MIDQPITPLTSQQVFDNALFGIRGQQYQASVAAGGTHCRYRGPLGRKCGIGHSIPDALAKQDHEGKTVRWLVLVAADGAPPWRGGLGALFSNVPMELLSDVQRTHDNLAYPDESWPDLGSQFEADMAVLARTYHLTYTAPA